MTGPGLVILVGTVVVALIVWGVRAVCRRMVSEYADAFRDFTGGYRE